MLALGEYHVDRRGGHVSLEDARKARAAARELVKKGIHPVRQRQAERAERIAASAETFEAVAREWLERQRAKWTPIGHARVVRWFERDVFPDIGALPIRDIKPAAILAIMQRVAAGKGRGETEAPTVALLLRQHCSRVFNFAVATLRAEADPTAVLRGSVSAPPVRHRRPLARERFPELLKGLRSYAGDAVTAIALELLLLTFVRQGELRAAEWTEIDFERAEWRIPAAKMKMRTPHVVPLSTRAIELLRQLQTITGQRRYLFPNVRRPLSYMGKTTLNAALVRLGFDGEFTPHATRATASTLLNEAGFAADVIERQLAHQERNAVRASYNHAEYLPERRKMMQAWADMVDTLSDRTGKVVPLRKHA